MIGKNICPGCGRHCDLSEPHCGRGEEYSRTGEMPERKEKKQDHAMGVNDKLIINLRDLNYIMRMLYEGKASQKRILMILKERDGITQRDLTERLGIQPGSASEILAKLESAGWILRTQNEADRRTTDVRLTDSGRELAAEALEQRRKRHEEMFSCLSEKERLELLELLERVCADWKSRYGDRGRAHGRSCQEDLGFRHGHIGHGGPGGRHGEYGSHEGPGRHRKGVGCQDGPRGQGGN